MPTTLPELARGGRLNSFLSRSIRVSASSLSSIALWSGVGWKSTSIRRTVSMTRGAWQIRPGLLGRVALKHLGVCPLQLRLGSRAELARCLGLASECYNVLYNTVSMVMALAQEPFSKRHGFSRTKTSRSGKMPREPAFSVLQTACHLGRRPASLRPLVCQTLRIPPDERSDRQEDIWRQPEEALMMHDAHGTKCTILSGTAC